MLQSLSQLVDQPKGLFTLCFTELWERFGYYLLTTILVLFLTQSAHLSEHDANLLYGAFAALLYVTPVIGGWLADKFLGFRQAVLIGAGALFIGYVLMIFSDMHLFILGLSFLIIGNGFLKPSVSSIVGDLYGQGEAKREGGFTLFYMGINIGSIIPPLIAGSVVLHWGWHYGFALAAAGMVICVLTFTLSSRVIWRVGNIPQGSPLKRGISAATWFNLKLYIGTLVCVGLIYVGVEHAQATTWVVIVAAIVFTLYVLRDLFKEDVAHRYAMIAALVLIVLSVGFWALYNQTFTSLMLFANRNMDKQLFYWHITPEFTQFYNGFFIIILSPFFNYLWMSLNKYKLNPSFPMKFALGILFMSLGFLLLTWGTAARFSEQGIISGWWLIGSYFLQTIGELCLSPIGLAMITMLAPKHLVGTMMGVWFFASAGAYAITGMLANWAVVPVHETLSHALAIYHHAFGLWTAMSFVLTIISFICYPFLKRMIMRSHVLY